MTARKAAMSDIPTLLELINKFAREGIMLPRTEFEMAENIRDFTVVTDGASLLGCAALHFYSPAYAEVRSLAVSREAQGRGVGRVLMEALEREAGQFGLHALFAFTYVPGFFRKLGYGEVERGELPLKVWKDCLRCPKFNCCDEIAMKKVIGSGPAIPMVGDEETEAALVQLPVAGAKLMAERGGFEPPVQV